MNFMIAQIQPDTFESQAPSAGSHYVEVFSELNLAKRGLILRDCMMSNATPLTVTVVLLISL